MSTIRRRVLVHGRVQGVGFRYWTRGEAARLGVHGWVRNRSDGTVEAEAEGDEGAVNQLLDSLRRGPAGAIVENLDISEIPPEDESDFRIRAGEGGRMSGWFRRG